MITPTIVFGSILPATAAALLLAGILVLPLDIAGDRHNDAFSEVWSGNNAETTSHVDRSRKGDRLETRPAAQAVNTTIIPRVVFSPAETPGLSDVDDREHPPAREPAPLADCVGHAHPATGRDISSCFV